MKKTLILDEKTWRCGDESKVEENKRGKGLTAMINNEGFRCCLGQFSLQLNKKVELSCDMGDPSDMIVKVPLLNRKSFGNWVNTKLSSKAININDDTETSIEEKVNKLKKLFKSKGVKIVFRRKK